MVKGKAGGLGDAPKTPFIQKEPGQERRETKGGKPLKPVETVMLNTRVPKDLMKKLKIYCVTNETTIQKFITEMLQKKLK